MKYSFSGHETFACKQYWLKKGVDYLQEDRLFTDENAVVELGVGKNMVASIKHWIKAFGLLNERDQPNELATFLFGEEGNDIYLEDSITLWLLHYQLINQEKATLYNLVFNYFRRERQEFTKDHLKRFLRRKVEENQDNFSAATLNNDIKVFFSNYISSNNQDIEEGYSNVLQELNLLSQYSGNNDKGEKVDWYRFDVSQKYHLPIEMLLFVILDKESEGLTFSLAELANEPSFPGSVFLMNEMALAEKLKNIPSEYGLFTETAGNPVLQLREGLNKWELLANYYVNN